MASSEEPKMQKMDIERGDMKKEEREKKGTQSKDSDDRDPHHVNDHLAVGWSEVIAEPDGVHSSICVWAFAQSCFGVWKWLAYSLMACICGVPMSVCWGCHFAYTSFCHIWMVTPCFRILTIECGCYKRLWGLCVHCFCDPICDAFSGIFGPFRRN